MLRALVGLVVGAWVLVSEPTLASSTQSDYLQGLLAKARAMDLADRPQWYALLHYEPSYTGGVVSRADDPAFFLSPKGKTNPRAELAATLRAFFAEPTAEQPLEAGEAGKQHPQCAFPARYHWLKGELGFDSSHLPESPCLKFIRWRERLDPAGLTLIFPSAYMNNPSSMFGHTLLRLDRPGQTADTRMLAYSVNYAAVVGQDGGIMFALKGLTGFYPGYFSIAPYYERLKHYSDLESRDIWEYQLNVTQAELDRIVRHLWELREVRFDYYFFDENCSSQLLTLLEVARPELDLTEEFAYWAIPAEIVRAVRQIPGLVAEVSYHPALETQLIFRARQLSPGHQDLAKAIALGQLSPEAPEVTRLVPERRARTLELAYHYLRYLNANGERARDKIAPISREVLVARSRLPIPPMEQEPSPPTTRPDQGHRFGRLRFGLGVREGRGFQELQFRPAYHDLLDPPGGFVPGAQIGLLKTAVRHYQRGGKVELNRVELVDILSLAPRDRFRRPISWKINTAVGRYPLDPGRGFSRRPWRWRTNGGAGLAWGGGGGGTAYTFLEATLDVAPTLSPSVAVGPGLRAGWISDPLRRWRIHLHGGLQRFALGEAFTEVGIRLDQRVTLTQNQALRLGVARRMLFDRWWTTVQVSWDWYL